MSLLLPFGLVVFAIAVLGLLAWRDRETGGSLLAMLMYFIAFAGPLACLALGGWSWFRTGQWQSLTVGALLAFARQIGVDTSTLLQPVASPALQAAHQLYLESNVGWTLLAVPALVILAWHRISGGGRK